MINFAVKRNKNFIQDNINKFKKGDKENRAARLGRIERAKELLSGKVSIIWIYAISGEVDNDLRDRIFEVYKGLMDDSVIVPFVEHAW